MSPDSALLLLRSPRLFSTKLVKVFLAVVGSCRGSARKAPQLRVPLLRCPGLSPGASALGSQSLHCPHPRVA